VNRTALRIAFRMTRADTRDMTTNLSDITWADMTAAGIDTDKVKRSDPRLGTDEYIYQDEVARLKVAFGPAVDPDDGSVLGWDICAYDLVDRNDGDPAWEDFAQYWAEDAAEALRFVAERIAKRSI
jgi:hypothetical protein